MKSNLPKVSAPGFIAPPGACDCHCHVFGPYDRFPLASERTYEPPEAPPHAYLAMLDMLGMGRGVLIQASAHGLDNRAMLHALSVAPDRLRGVAVADTSSAASDLQMMWNSGVRGLRFSRLLDESGEPRYKNAVDLSELPPMLPLMRDLGMHVQLWTGLDQLGDLLPLIQKAGVPFVLDHMGRPHPGAGLESKEFGTLCRAVADGNLYVKLTPYRPSVAAPLYEDMRPYHERLLQIRPDRLLWGSDWPHINMAANIPDAGQLLNLLNDWTRDSGILDQILVRNPAELYGF